MLIAFDTATQTASIAIYDLAAQKLLSEWTWQARRRQTQDLLATAKTMLQQMGLRPQSITAVAVTTGPGSFTGVRIAISAAKGIGLGLPVVPKVIGLPTLSVTAAPLLALCHEKNVSLCAYLQAGRGRYNWAYLPTNAVDSPLLWQPGVSQHEAGTTAGFVTSLKSHIDREVWVIGEKTAELDEALADQPNITLIDEVSSTRRAGQLARLAAAHIDAGNDLTLSALSPLYLRSP